MNWAGSFYSGTEFKSSREYFIRSCIFLNEMHSQLHVAVTSPDSGNPRSDDVRAGLAAEQMWWGDFMSILIDFSLQHQSSVFLFAQISGVQVHMFALRKSHRKWVWRWVVQVKHTRPQTHTHTHSEQHTHRNEFSFLCSCFLVSSLCLRLLHFHYPTSCPSPGVAKQRLKAHWK